MPPETSTAHSTRVLPSETQREPPRLSWRPVGLSQATTMEVHNRRTNFAVQSHDPDRDDLTQTLTHSAIKAVKGYIEALKVKGDSNLP